MNIPLNLNTNEVSATDTMSITQTMENIGQAAKAAAKALAVAPTEQKNQALNSMAENITANSKAILAANEKDITTAKAAGKDEAFIDRLKLNQERITAIAEGLKTISQLNDPVGQVTANWTQPNGLNISRVQTPLGVIGIIYESRPNVTADAGALCLKAGNAAILRGGSDSFHSSVAIHQALTAGLKAAGLPETAIQLVPTTDRAAVGEMLKGLGNTIDVIVPRGGKSLVARVQDEARVPVFSHLEGICHIYVDRSADKDMAINIAVNAKMRRTGVCGAAETLLLDKALDAATSKAIIAALIDAGCTIKADPAIQQLDERCEPATTDDWGTEYLSNTISAKMVDGVAQAIEHVSTHSSNHTEAIIAENSEVVEAFINQIDSAIIMHNTSTQFADGGEFGMGAEIGIATGKMHARGPVGVDQLTSFKYVVRGQGQVRPV